MDALLTLDKLPLLKPTWQDLLDILLVTLFLYNLLLLIRGTRAVQILLGILLLVGLYWSARYLDLDALETTLDRFFVILPVAVIVLFRDEIRRALATFGRTPFGQFKTLQRVADTFNELVLAATTLAERKTGALIAIERHNGLRNYVENGIALDAMISLDLLISLFSPDTPTHDGAVIIQGDRIAAATCFLPLTQNPQLSKDLGTRHRAALGLTEETDALAVVVSEETGQISLAFDGKLVQDLSSKDLRNQLYKLLISDSGDPGLEAR